LAEEPGAMMISGGAWADDGGQPFGDVEHRCP
jgi:hypothetical protein